MTHLKINSVHKKVHKRDGSFCVLLVMLLLTIGMASCTIIDNPVSDNPQPAETPEQQAFWAQFEAWKTDSCTVGDDFHMHMIGSWWWNPVDIFPKGMIPYSYLLNSQRVNEIRQSNADLVHLKKNREDTPMMNDDEVLDMVNTKVDELWAGATTREEALAALGRAWAEGYTMAYEPIVVIKDGVPTWQLIDKIPSYITEDQLYYGRMERARALAPRPNARLTKRAALQASADLDIIVKAMNIGVDHIDIADNVLSAWQNAVQNELGTVDDIRNEIKMNVLMLDGALVNEACAKKYDAMVAECFKAKKKNKSFELTVNDIRKHVNYYMASLYALKDYNKLITPKARQQYKDNCEDFRMAMLQRLVTNEWLEDATRQNAIDKLDHIVFYVGGIDDNGIPDCVIPQLTGKDIVEDVRQLRKARLDGYRWAIGRSREATAILMDHLYYLSDLVADNAFYFPEINAVVINPSNLCPAYVNEDYDYTMQLAILASTIGHELTHAFDSDSSKFDKWGNIKNWWTDADAAKFEARCNQLVENYNSLQLMPWADATLYGDGKNTLAENIADLGGCCLGLHILLRKYRDASAAEKKALMQRYFQGWAIQWSMVYNLAQAQQAKANDYHSLTRERTNGVVRNMDEWYKAFDITSGTLWLRPSERAEIW